MKEEAFNTRDEMKNTSGVISEIKKAMEFYRELGFEYLPVKKAIVSDLLTLKPDISVKEQTGTHSGAGKNKDEALDILKNMIGDCKRCKLSKGRKNIVFGEGSPDARLMFIGEGPGRDEDIQGRPFVGDAGKLLTNLIVKLELRREDVYIANMVKCRPPHNRNPEADEISVCRQFVEQQIDIIKPDIIVCLGRIAAHALLGVGVPISRLRGNFSTYKQYRVMPTFHPAYLLRNPKDKWLTWDDMQKVLQELH